MAPSLTTSWKHKLDRIYNDQILSLTVNHAIFRQARETWQKHSSSRTAAELAWWMTQSYIAFAATTVRRVSEPPPKNSRPGQNTLSLVVIISELHQNRKLLSREWYTRKYPKKSRVYHSAGRDFDSIAGRENSKWIPATRFRSDIARVRHAAAPFKRLADKAVAHTEFDRRRIGRPTWDKLDQAIKTIVEVYERYYLLITATSFNPMDIADKTDVSEDLAKIWPS